MLVFKLIYASKNALNIYPSVCPSVSSPMIADKWWKWINQNHRNKQSSYLKAYHINAWNIFTYEYTISRLNRKKNTNTNESKVKTRWYIHPVLYLVTCTIYIDGLVQDPSNPISNALGLLQSCTMPSICYPRYLTCTKSSLSDRRTRLLSTHTCSTTP